MDNELLIKWLKWQAESTNHDFGENMFHVSEVSLNLLAAISLEWIAFHSVQDWYYTRGAAHFYQVTDLGREAIEQYNNRPLYRVISVADDVYYITADGFGEYATWYGVPTPDNTVYFSQSVAHATELKLGVAEKLCDYLNQNPHPHHTNRR